MNKVSYFNNTSENSENRMNDEVKLYPNPTNNKATITINTDYKGLLKVKIISITGETLFSGEKADFNQLDELPLDLSNYSSGIYFVRIEYADKVKTVRLNRMN